MTLYLSTSTPLQNNPTTPVLYDIIADERQLLAQHHDPFPYPPPFQVKRDEWYLSNANIFISVRGKLYGLRRDRLPPGCLFVRDSYVIQPTELYPRGFPPSRPFPIPELTYLEFDEFLIFFYYTEYFYGDEERWRRVCVLAQRLGFHALSYRAFVELQYFSYSRFGPQMRCLMIHRAPHHIRTAFHRRQRPLMVFESDMDSEIISDDSI